MYLGGAEEEDGGDYDVDLNEKMLHTNGMIPCMV
jgi:hypothetical protein